MRFSFLGTGFIFPTHLKAIQEVGGEIVGYDTNEDCVVILAPNDKHFSLCLQEVKKGKKVLCEKPLVISSVDAKILAQFPNIYTVFQLRHHPILKEIEVKDINHIDMDISVHRDDKYFNSWKGQNERSGGIIFNLGIHFFDVLIQLFGFPTHWETFHFDIKGASGLMRGDKYECNWRLKLDEDKKTQRRVLKINQKEYNLSAKENLAYENLHKYVYQDLLEGKGVQAKEVVELIHLLEKLSLK